MVHASRILAGLAALSCATQTVANLPATPPGVVLSSDIQGQARTAVILDQAYAYIPASIGKSGRPAPLLVFFHGARRDPKTFLEKLAPEADRHGFVILTPISRGPTWDAVERARTPGSYQGRLRGRSPYAQSGDVKRVRETVSLLSNWLQVTSDRTAIAGFSDGASFAIAYGMDATTPASVVLAFSPGVWVDVPRVARGRPVLIAHGEADSVLSYSVSCDQVAANVKRTGGQLTFRTFDGDHVMPTDVVGEFLDAAFGPANGEPARPIKSTSPNCG